MESIVAANGSSAGGDFLLNRLPWRTSVFIDTGYDNPIESVVNIARRHQIPHGRLQGLVPHPMLHCAHIEAGTEHARRIRRTKSLQVEPLRVQPCALRNGFTLEQHVVFSVAGRRWEYKPLAVEVRAGFEQFG